MNILWLSILSFVMLLAGLGVLVFSLKSMTEGEIAGRLQDYVTAQDTVVANNPAQVAIKRDLSGSFGKRILIPGFKKLGRLFGRLTPTATIESLGHQLAIAGNPLGLGAREFYGIRLVFQLMGYGLAFVVIRSGLTMNNLMIAAFAVLLCQYLPKSWLRSRVRGRQDKVRKGLPDALDMLSVCADAGLGFDQSLQRVSEYWKTPVGVEFGRVVSEMGMGVSRRSALRSLAERLDISELSSFVAVILQSDQLGMSIAETLHSQAKQMREERRFRAQETARKMPLKMLFPMLILIFPSLYAVVLGPIVPTIMEFFKTMSTNMR